MGGFDSKLPKKSPRAPEMNGKADNRIVVDVNSALKAREGEHVRIQRGDRGSGPTLKNHKNIGSLSNTGLDLL